MKVLVIGGGGREHALAWRLAASPRGQRVFVAPGNGGTARDARLHNVAIGEPAALADFAHGEKVTLTVVGPEAPLAAGVVDVFRARGLRIFGRDDSVAVLEPNRLGGFLFTPAAVGARPVDLDARVIGRARMLPGFNGTYAEQRLVRCLAAYVIEGRSVPAVMLAQALMADNNQYFDRIEDDFSRVMEEFRFTRAFAKPIAINRKTGPLL